MLMRFIFKKTKKTKGGNYLKGTVAMSEEAL